MDKKAAGVRVVWLAALPVLWPCSPPMGARGDCSVFV